MSGEAITLSPETIAAVARWQTARDAYMKCEAYGTEEFRDALNMMITTGNMALLHLGVDRARAR